MHRDLALALALADASDELTMNHFRTTFAIRTKSDRTPVSEVDEAVERMLRARLAAERPGDAVVGEEFGTSPGITAGTSGHTETARRWIVDPIDATKNYIRGIPVFATLIALEENGILIAGVVSAPALHRRWYAARSEGAFCNGDRIRVSSAAEIEEAHLSYDDLAGFTKAGLETQFLDAARRFGRTRGFGDFWSHMLVAEGAIDAAIEPEVALWDLAALQLIVEEAGGRFTSLRGEPRPDAGSAVSTNGILHDKVLGVFA
jgi:histidinol-phosphatase